MHMEEFFKESVARLRDRHLASYDRQPPAHTFSPEFEKGMRELVAQKRRGELRVHVGRVWRQAACFGLATVIGLGACFVGVGAWSSRFLRMVEQKYPDHTSIHFDRTGKGSPQTSDAQYTLAKVPEGFRRVEHTNSPDGFLNSVQFENSEGVRIGFDQTFAENIGMAVDTEGAELEHIEFRGHPARFLDNDGWCMLLWYDDKYVYMLDTDLPRDETMKIAEDIRIKSAPYPTMQEIPIESLPEQYPEALALENGDVVIREGSVANLEKLEAFVVGCGEGKDGVVRIVRYAPDGSALIDDLQMQDGHLYYTYDQHRWEESGHPWESGEEYDSIGIFSNGSTNVILLYSQHYDSPKEVLRFELPQG